MRVVDLLHAVDKKKSIYIFVFLMFFILLSVNSLLDYNRRIKYFDEKYKLLVNISSLEVLEIEVLFRGNKILINDDVIINDFIKIIKKSEKASNLRTYEFTDKIDILVKTKIDSFRFSLPMYVNDQKYGTLYFYEKRKYQDLDNIVFYEGLKIKDFSSFLHQIRNRLNLK